jgi:KDO2-lipid IV(A) lauroyltransferase
MAKQRSPLWHVGQGAGYVAVRWIMAWMQVLGWAASRQIGRALGMILYYALGRRRRTAMDNMLSAKIVSNAAQAEWLTRAMFQNLGMMAAEVALIPVISRRRSHAPYVRVEHKERVQDALALGKGVIISIGHLGNWETGAIGFCREVIQLHSVYRPLDYPPLDRLIHRLRTAAGMALIANDEAVPRIVRVLKRGGAVALLTDQDARSEGIFIQFFGRPASTLPTPAVLSLRFGTPIVPVHVFRTATQIVVRADPMIRPEAFAQDPDPRKAITQEVARRGEKFIREHPAQWFWLHRRWKTQPT